eukprot:5883346-Pleurochrysis_carterae.AAC.1
MHLFASRSSGVRSGCYNAPPAYPAAGPEGAFFTLNPTAKSRLAPPSETDLPHRGRADGWGLSLLKRVI